MKRLTLLALAMAACFSAAAQNAATKKAEIVGKAYYQMVMNLPTLTVRSGAGVAGAAGLPDAPSGPTTIEIPVAQAEVVVVSGKDTLRTKTDAVGAFRFRDLEPGEVHLSMTADSYAPFSESFELMPGENVVILSRQTKRELEAATVVAEAPIMTMKGDTLVYHTAAMNVQAGDFAVDLLKQMPGVEMKNGQIFVTGKAVRRSYVNGALIFGLDPMASMEYLQADQVVAMEVYDEDNPMDARDGVIREKDRVINIRTRDPIFSATDLQLRGIAGADQLPKEDGSPQLRYTAGANAHFFSELKQLSADIVTGNVGMRSSNLNLTPTAQTSYLDNTDLSLGFARYNDNIYFGNGISVSYSFAHQQTRSRSRQLQQYFETAGVPGRLVDNEQSTTNRTNTHRLTVNYDYRTGKLLSLNWRQGLQLNTDGSRKQVDGQTTVAGGEAMLRDARSRSDNKSWTLDESMSLNFKGGKPLPRIGMSLRLGRNNLDAWDLDTLASSYSKRYLTKAGSGLSQRYMASVDQTILTRTQRDGTRMRRLQLTGNYLFTYISEQKRQEAYDLYGSPAPVANTANTFDYTYASTQNALGLNLTLTSYNGVSLMLRLSAEADRVIDHERIPAFEPNDKVFYSLLPSVSLSLKGVSVTFSTQTRVPSVEQIRRRVDDTNPLSLIAGNPDLRQSIHYTFRVGKNSVRPTDRHMITWNVQAQLVAQPIVSKTTFFAAPTVLDAYDGYTVVAGSTLQRSENADRSLNLSGDLSLSSQWGGSWKIATQFAPSVTYRSTPQYFGEALDFTREFTPSLRLSGTLFPFRNMTVTVDANTAFVRARNGSGSMDRHALRNQIDLQAGADFLRNAFFSGKYSWYAVRDFDSAALDNDVHRLDLSLGVNLLRKQLKIAVSGIDLLRGGSQYSVNMGPSSMTQVWRQAYGRYFVLDISYRFNNTGGTRRQDIIIR